MRERLRDALMKRYPAIKITTAERCVDRYVHEVTRELAAQYALAKEPDLLAGEVSFGAETVMRGCKQVMLNGKQLRVWSVMQAAPATSLVIAVFRGNNLSGRVSRVTINPAYKKEIMDELKNHTTELNSGHLQRLEDEANWETKVDPGSLTSYITATRRTLGKHGKGTAYENKLVRSLLVATSILSRVKQHADGTHYVREYWKQIDSGRVYGHGLSLQRVPREVRNAALGECHKYDFKASSYALLTSLAVQINPALNVGALKDYIKARSRIRERIAQDVGISEDWAKTIFTALGFGADLKDNPHNAIRSMLGQEKYARLMANQEFALIATQLKAASKVINDEFPNAGFTFYEREYSPIDPNTGSKRTRSQKLAWIYQCMESEALTCFVDLAKVEPLLVAHDCVYFKRPLSPAKAADIAYMLSLRFPLLRFEHEVVIPIHAEEDHGQRDREIDRRQQDHVHHIAQQERAATAYPSLYTAGNQSAKRFTQTPWGEIDAAVWAEFTPTQPKPQRTTATEPEDEPQLWA